MQLRDLCDTVGLPLYEQLGKRLHLTAAGEALARTARSVSDTWGAFCAAHPQIDISLQVLNRDGVVARLRGNRDDLYVVSIPPVGMALAQHAFMRVLYPAGKQLSPIAAEFLAHLLAAAA